MTKDGANTTWLDSLFIGELNKQVYEMIDTIIAGHNNKDVGFRIADDEGRGKHNLVGLFVHW